MASYCKQCSIDIFGEDYEDHAGLCEEGMYVTVICEGCGVTCVDHEGRCCVDDCLVDHETGKDRKEKLK